MAVTPNLGLASPLAAGVAGWITRFKSDLNLIDQALAGLGGAANILVNPSFEFNQRSLTSYTGDNVYGMDRWYVDTPAAETIVLSRDASETVDVSSAYSAKVVFTLGAGAFGRLGQLLENPTRYRGKPLAGRVPVKTSTANAVRAMLAGCQGGTRYSAYHPGDGEWHDLDVSGTIDLAAVAIEFGTDSRLDNTHWADNATLVPGLVPLPYVPLHPADERARVDRYFEVHVGNGATDWPYFQGYASAGGQDLIWTVPWHTVKGTTDPTIAIGGTWVAVNTGNSVPVLVSSNDVGYAVKVTSTAAGLVSIRGDHTAGPARGSISGASNP